MSPIDKVRVTREGRGVGLAWGCLNPWHGLGIDHFFALTKVQVDGEVEERCRDAEMVRLDLVYLQNLAWA